MEDYVSGERLLEEEDIVHMASVDSTNPICFEDAVKSTKWRQTMEDEIVAIEKNDTWKLVELPNGAKKIGVKWIYKTKLNEHGEVDKFKAQLVAMGYSQNHGIDYNEVFAPIARMDIVTMVITLAAR
uniref:Retrovirus-related Pol polyprotein from transposon TNT 1-94 n=1 Tax=Cajanus cajan TaxID=3821 RepID=A0A151S241_CAJCA|nr:Retrovirus-related Pol polyprotein from transposon TNT 1-94 [Cajanus cajan]